MSRLFKYIIYLISPIKTIVANKWRSVVNEDEMKALKIEMLEIATQINEEESSGPVLVKLIGLINQLDEKIHYNSDEAA